MVIFVRIVQLGSLAKAADSLRLSRPAVTRHLKETEDLLQTSLLRRTTRALSLTDSGLSTYRCFEPLLQSLDLLNRSVEELSKGKSLRRVRKPSCLCLSPEHAEHPSLATTLTPHETRLPNHSVTL